MKIRIKRIDKSLPLPEYKTAGAAAFDLYAREDAIVAPKSLVRIPGNFIIETPPGYALILASRSSTPKRGLHIPHGIGVIDRDYCGDNDELSLQFYNHSDEPVEIKRGERIAQGMFVQIAKTTEWQETDTMGDSRGGFGSTGVL